MQYKIEKWNRKMKSLYKIAIWNHSMKLHYEIALWNCIKKSQYEIAIWNRNMKLHHAIANGNGPLYAAGGLKIVTSQIPQIWVLQKIFSYAKRFWRAAASASKSSALSASPVISWSSRLSVAIVYGIWSARSLTTHRLDTTPKFCSSDWGSSSIRRSHFLYRWRRCFSGPLPRRRRRAGKP